MAFIVQVIGAKTLFSLSHTLGLFKMNQYRQKGDLKLWKTLTKK